MFKLLRIPRQLSALLSELEMFFTLRGRTRVLAFGTHRTKHNEFLQSADALLGKVLRFYAMKLIALLQQAQEVLFVCVTLVYRGMLIPYAIELYRSKADCQERHLPFRKQHITLERRAMQPYGKNVTSTVSVMSPWSSLR